MSRVAAVIVTYNNAHMLRDLLGDLGAQSRPPDEIVVVDNASSDGTEHEVRVNHPSARYVRLAENTGSAGGYHEGIRTALATADFIWTLDDDVRLETRSLELLLQGLETVSASGRIGAVRSVGAGHPSALPTELDIVPWRGTLFPATVIRTAGLPEREYFLYGEDLEYSLRLKRLGYSFFWIPASRCIESRKGKVRFSVLGRPGEAYPTAWALYYAFRNEASIYLRYRGYARLLRTMLYGLKVALYVCAAERARCTAKLAAIARGLRDGCLDRLGRNQRYLP
ncbi:MAG TPA: glycosyltransferase [Candidatus Methylomirabilis sp.]|nr:glycosyltransferase [Candidatus Methylomirabilis sp.]